MTGKMAMLNWLLGGEVDRTDSLAQQVQLANAQCRGMRCQFRGRLKSVLSRPDTLALCFVGGCIKGYLNPDPKPSVSTIMTVTRLL
jgi:hypothetical protein